MKKFILASGGVVLIILVILGGVFLIQNNIFSPGGSNIGTSGTSTFEISTVGSKAFGSLAAVSGTSQGESKDRLASSPITATPPGPLGMGAGGYGGGGVVGPTYPDGFRYEPTIYKYVYKGEPIEIPAQISVLKRIKGNVATSEVLNALSTFLSGAINLSAFRDVGLESFSFSENRDSGYTVWVSPSEGTLSLSQNWKTWPYAKQCMNGCPPQEPLVAGDVPGDEEIKNIAESFLNDYGIAHNNYADPQIIRYDNIATMVNSDEPSSSSSMPIMPYISEEVQVVYPLKINGEIVYGEDGRPSGLFVSVNLRERKVSNLNGLDVQHYESSSYDAEQNLQKLLDYASNQYWYGYEENVKEVEVELSAPSQGYIKMWVYDGIDNKELLVRALIFKVTNPIAGLNTDTVVIPLAKEIIDQRTNQIVPLPRPLSPETMQ
ncbi:MAG: hypothetical protein UT82_C0008G0009 [Parcubacteria group bacterium GW2011_GWB1_40_14]|nr:MAG: hypothetical protein UT82_C0008G0009 [Parcubacteria group bacterium GW2011_GWB1_40_14]